jgi:hypothetical protein
MGTKVSAAGPGTMIKVRYLGDAEEPQLFVGAATRTEYHFGGRINLGEVDSRDLMTGASYAPGLFELTGPSGEKLFAVHIPRQRKTKGEAKEPEEEPSDAEGAVSGD